MSEDTDTFLITPWIFPTVHIISMQIKKQTHREAGAAWEPHCPSASLAQGAPGRRGTSREHRLLGGCLGLTKSPQLVSRTENRHAATIKILVQPKFCPCCWLYLSIECYSAKESQIHKTLTALNIHLIYDFFFLHREGLSRQVSLLSKNLNRKPWFLQSLCTCASPCTVPVIQGSCSQPLCRQVTSQRWDFRQREQLARLLSQLVFVTFNASREFIITQEQGIFVSTLALLFPF